MAERKENLAAGKVGEADSWGLMRQYGYVRPTSQQRRNLVEAYADIGLPRKGCFGRFRKPRRVELRKSGFDLIRESDSDTISDPTALAVGLEHITLFELKTAGHARKSLVDDNWNGLGFSLTSGEKENAETLGENFKFLFLNLKNGALTECNLDDFFTPVMYDDVSRIYPTWSVFIKGLDLSRVQVLRHGQEGLPNSEEE